MSSPLPAAPVVRASGLAAAYPGQPPIWEGASFDVEAGEFVALLGPNGAGKSTMLKLLLGMLRPAAGSVEVLGVPPQRGSAAVGYVPQSRAIDSEAAIRGVDLVRLGLDGHRWGFAVAGRTRRHAHQLLVEEVIDAVGATGYARRRIGQMSGGERQRLWLAQALISNPKLLLLDEPLASLDLRNQAAMAELVGQLARERNLSVVLVAHDVNPLRNVVDRVCYIAHGHIAIGPPDEVITTERLSPLYGAPVEVLIDSRGRRFVVGIDEELAHPHPEGEPGRRS
jgi:zinc/manganese transport system ATP-binding protein